MELGSEFNPAINPTERVYNLRAKVHVVRHFAKQGLDERQHETKSVVLVPCDNDETTRFYMAWLPDDKKNKPEVLCQMGRPVYGACRMAVMRDSELFPKGPHLFVMSVGVEEILLNKEGEIIEFSTEPGSNDSKDSHAVDFVDTNRSIDKI